jgi:hypothetical protein
MKLKFDIATIPSNLTKTITTTNELLGAFILEVKLGVHFDITNAIPEVDPSIRLEIKSTNKNIYGRQTWS